MSNPKQPRGRQCYHCKTWLTPGDGHDCWTTTEAALTEPLSDDLREAWERLRECAAELGEQRIYASGSCIMFARKTCYAFVRPKPELMELCLFLDRDVKAPQVHRVERRSTTKIAHLVRITHRDEVEAPLTNWLREAYELQDALAATSGHPAAPARTARSAKAPRTRAQTITATRKARAITSDILDDRRQPRRRPVDTPRRNH